MLNPTAAANVIKRNIPNGKIQSYIDYKNLYVFQVFLDDPFESDMDPFYSVNKETGVFDEFSIFLDGDISEITQLFMKAKGING